MTQRWDAARSAQQRITPTKRRVPGPVGEHPPMLFARACKGCGYHVCSCERQQRVQPSVYYERCERQELLQPRPMLTPDQLSADRERVCNCERSDTSPHHQS